MKKCNLASCERHFQRKYGSHWVLCIHYSSCRSMGNRGKCGSPGSAAVLLFTHTLLFHRTFLSVGFECRNQLCWPWRWDWNQGTITLMSLLEDVSAQPGLFILTYQCKLWVILPEKMSREWAPVALSGISEVHLRCNCDVTKHKGFLQKPKKDICDCSHSTRGCQGCVWGAAPLKSEQLIFSLN